MVALTFDDGPKPEFCQPIMDILDKYGAKATFFVVGKEAEDNPDLIMRMENSGDEIGNHSYSHTSVKDRPAGEALADIQKCSEVIYNITGEQPSISVLPEADIIRHFKGFKEDGAWTSTGL